MNFDREQTMIRIKEHFVENGYVPWNHVVRSGPAKIALTRF